MRRPSSPRFSARTRAVSAKRFSRRFLKISRRWKSSSKRSEKPGAPSRRAAASARKFPRIRASASSIRSARAIPSRRASSRACFSEKRRKWRIGARRRRRISSAPARERCRKFRGNCVVSRTETAGTARFFQNFTLMEMPAESVCGSRSSVALSIVRVRRTSKFSSASGESRKEKPKPPPTP